MAKTAKVPLQCTTGHCTCPHGYLLPGGVVSVMSRHHGQRHPFSIDLQNLVRLFVGYQLVDRQDLENLRILIAESLQNM